MELTVLETRNEITNVTNAETQDIATKLLLKTVEKGLDVATIEKILNLRERIVEENRKKEFFVNLAALQAEIPAIRKDKVIFNKDGSVRYRYASYDTILETIQPVLFKYGFSVTFKTNFEERFVEVICILKHIAGHEESTVIKVPVDTSSYMSDIQKIGSSLTYARRYALCLALNLVADDDTDGNTEEDNFGEDKGVITEVKENNGDKKEKDEKDNGVTEKQLKAILALLKDKTKEERLTICKNIIGREIASSKDLTKAEASMIIDTLRYSQDPF